MTDNDFSSWNDSNRDRCIHYLEKEGIEKPQVGASPAFEIAPHFGIWCVESKKVSGKIGWWVFSGDCPTDYVTEKGKCHPREALGELIESWASYIPEMKKGKQPSDCRFGDGSNLEELGDLLEKRVTILRDWFNDDALWKER